MEELEKNKKKLEKNLQSLGMHQNCLIQVSGTLKLLESNLFGQEVSVWAELAFESQDGFKILKHGQQIQKAEETKEKKKNEVEEVSSDEVTVDSQVLGKRKNGGDLGESNNSKK